MRNFRDFTEKNIPRNAVMKENLSLTGREEIERETKEGEREGGEQRRPEKNSLLSTEKSSTLSSPVFHKGFLCPIRLYIKIQQRKENFEKKNSFRQSKQEK